MPTITMFDQRFFDLACQHQVYRSSLEHHRDIAGQIDQEARNRNETIVRAYE